MSGALAALVGFSFGGRPTNFGGTLQVSDTEIAVANVAFEFDGDIMATATGTVVVDTITGDTWFSPRQAGAGSRYWVRATLSSGATPSGDLNTWLALDTPGGLSWEIGVSGNDTLSSTLLFEISSTAAGSNIVASGTVILTASSTGGGGGGGMP
jgi:hypothetical protein